MKLSKAEKDQVAEELNMPWGKATLRCDGYLVTLAVRRFGNGIKYRVMTYVNGVFKAAWCSETDAAPEAKFLRKSVRPNVSPAKRKQAEKFMGKRAVAKDPFWSGKMTLYLPDWSSGKAAVSHLCKACDSVELLTNEAAREALAAITEQSPGAESPTTYSLEA